MVVQGSRERLEPLAASAADLLNLVARQTPFTPGGVLAGSWGGIDLVGKFEHSWLAVNDGQLVGVLMSHERPADPIAEGKDIERAFPARCFYLAGLAVAPAARRVGVASALLSQWLEHAIAFEPPSVGPAAWALTTSASTASRPVRDLYERFGFLSTVRMDRSSGPVVVMWRGPRPA